MCATVVDPTVGRTIPLSRYRNMGIMVSIACNSYHKMLRAHVCSSAENQPPSTLQKRRRILMLGKLQQRSAFCSTLASPTKLAKDMKVLRTWIGWSRSKREATKTEKRRI